KKNLEGKLGHQAEELEDAIKRLTREYNSLKAEQEAAESVAKGYTRAVRAILEARDKRAIKGIHGTIAELAEVEQKYEVALNVAAGSRMQSIVVDDDEVAATAIQFLKSNGLGRATFLPLNKMLDGKPRGKAILAEKQAVGYAIDLVRFDQKFRAAFWYVFGDTVVVETLDHARKLMGGVRLVTIGGELLEASGAMVGGTVEGSALKFGNAAKGKLEELAEQLRRATEESEKVSEQLRSIRAELTALENRIRELSGTESTKDVRLGALESRKQEVKTRLAKTLEELKTKGEELKKVEECLVSLTQTIDALSREIEKMKEQRELDRRTMSELAPHDLSQKLKSLQSEIVELSSAVSELKAERETTQSQLDLAKERLSDVDAVEKDARDKIGKLKKEAKDAIARESKLKVELSGLMKIEESMGKEINELREKRDSLFKNKVTLEGEKDKVQSKIETASDISVGLTTKLSVAEEKLKELETEIKQYSIEIVPPLPSLEALKDSISSCESTLASMGAVNLKAIDDYGQKKSRYDELKNETQRLEAQKKDLLKLMGELNEKKKVGLFKVYDAVNDNFKRTYAELSGGGEAELVLENMESPFEGGLQIKAKPKNGKVLRLEALSGGEKSLTALAFVFAIQEDQPSPFYLLDEVDMFLDAINADMVAHRVQRASNTAQFVQISLRKVTLNKADHIIGVTKQEGGVSSVIMKPNIGEINDYQEELKVTGEKAAEGAS
ncbi:MAG: chromosome segregation protein SMC, partial [Methanomassiliicoccales archaeon]|nr:chromosome segregation protein SMC [Methanomassiliicoccales archaeon]